MVKDTIYRLSISDFNLISNKIARLDFKEEPGKAIELLGGQIIMQDNRLELAPREDELDVCVVYFGEDGKAFKDMLLRYKVSFDSIEPYTDGGIYRKYLKGKVIKEGENIGILK